MAVVTGTMSTLLPKLDDLLKEEYELQKGVRGEIMFLKAELESMQAALLKVSDASIDQPPDIQVNLWARYVKELSYDIEDIVDAFMVRVDTRAPQKLHGFRGFIDRCLDLLAKAKAHHKIGTDIKDIKSRIKEVSERRDRYKVDNVVAKPVGQTIDSLRLSALYKKATELVGIEEKSDDLIKRLMVLKRRANGAVKQQLKIVSIVGFGGLGKTTLANVVYQKLKVQFNCGAFVSVSLNPNMEKIFKNMLHQLGKSISEATWGEAQLIGEIREFLWNKRYFIVLDDIWHTSVWDVIKYALVDNEYGSIDDIWHTSVWDVIKYALVDNEYGSKIIITTRNLDVAKHVGGVYPLEPLSFVESRKLFLQRIFGVEDECPSQLVEVSEKILKKCGGVPLAIITIASLLASKEEKVNAYWSVYHSIGSGQEDSPDVDNMRRILSISYYDLPPYLKTCLLYLSLYPEDYDIRKGDLIWKWVGEGFVHNKQGKSLYKVGEDYFDELINKSLIQPGYIGPDNKLATCRVHDMVLDFITSLSKEEHFLTALDCQQPSKQVENHHCKVRRLSLQTSSRLSLQTSSEDVVTQLSAMSMSDVRSLIVVNQNPSWSQTLCFLPALLSFQVLRALDLSFCEVEKHHCKDICKLLHLRYLGLRQTFISEIPKEIGNLRFLQVLNIMVTQLTELPLTFLQLGQMVHLRVDRKTRLPDGFGNLKCLQELRAIRISSSTMLRELGRLTELRRLDLELDPWHESFQEPLLQCLSNLASLEILEMYGSNFLFLGFENLSPVPQQLRDIKMLGCIIHTVPRWMSSLSSLSSLCITLGTLGVGDLQVLGSIPSLRDLDIRVEEHTQGRDQRLVIGSDYPFRCLTRLMYLSCTMEVVFAQGAMQKLQTLSLHLFDVRQTIDQFGDFEFGLENLSSLGHVHVSMWRSFEATHGGMEAAEAAIRKALETNSNKPTIEFYNVMPDEGVLMPGSS